LSEFVPSSRHREDAATNECSHPPIESAETLVAINKDVKLARLSVEKLAITRLLVERCEATPVSRKSSGTRFCPATPYIYDSPTFKTGSKELIK
jgi:hypothetical protein